uniref:Heterogeneous nuclear ribonucleoprotein 1 n=1 Tax=Rhizophora mucronata TaxID=61149 RepID=A0A2P2JXQ5_RHIMU
MQSDNGKLFIGGISWDTGEDRLKDYFGSFGEVVEAVIMKDRTTGRARGFGFIVFADPAIAERVIKEKHNIDGRMVEAKKAIPRDDQNILTRNSGSSIHGSPGPGHTKKIFVGGLASTVTESDFKKYFDQFGTITDVVVMYDHNTQRPRGFGFITYDSEEAVERVLTKTFHELNGKMVEVKRAVPKLSPGPSRSPLGGYNYGLTRVNSFLNGYTQGYTPSTVGGYGLRMDGRFSSVAGGRSGFPPFDSGYGMSMNFEPAMSPGYGGSATFSSNLSYGRGVSPYYIGNTNRFASPIGYDGGNGSNTSFFSSVSRNLWGNGSLNYSTSSGSSNVYVGSSSGSIGGSTFGNSGVNWGSSSLLGQGGGNNVSNSSLNFGYGVGENSFGLDTVGYSRNSGNDVNQTSLYTAANGDFDGGLADLYGGGSDYGEPTWQSSNSGRERSGSFGYGLGNATSDVPVKSSPGFVGGYSVNKRQSNRGIAA